MNICLPHKSAPPELKKYYFGIYALSLVVLLVIVANIVGNFSSRSDRALEDTIEQQHTSIETYVASHDKLPDIVADAGITDTKSVEYKKISDSRYMLCATFKTKSDGYQPISEPAIESGNNVQLKADTKFTNGDTQGLKHDKGYTCIYYETYLANNPPTNNVTAKCSPNDSFPRRVSGTVTSVDTDNMEINIQNGGVIPPIEYNSGNGPSGTRVLSPLGAYTYDESTEFYDIDCK